MARSIRLSEELMSDVRREAAVQGRTLVGQAMHWARIGRAVEESGVLGYKGIRALLVMTEQVERSRDE